MKLLNKVKKIVRRSGKYLSSCLAILSLLVNTTTPFFLSYSYVAYAEGADALVNEEAAVEEESSGEESSADEEVSSEESIAEESSSEEESAPAEEGQASNENQEQVDNNNQVQEGASVGENVPLEEVAPVEEQPGDILEDGVSDYRPEEGSEEEPGAGGPISEPAVEPVTDIVDTSDPAVISIEEASSEGSAPKEIEQECLTEGQAISDSVNENWDIDEENEIAKTKENVKLGVRYIFPEDEKVTVTFTCLPKNDEDRSPLKIQKVKVGDLKLPNGVETSSEYAYDITTEMKNESFKYDLELPKPEGSEAEVSYIEMDLSNAVSEEVKAEDIKNIEDDKLKQRSDESDVKVEDLEHFTIFIVISSGSAPVLSSGVVNDQTEITVEPGVLIAVKVSATTSGRDSGNDWRSSEYKIGDGSWCVDTPDHDKSGTFTESFNITAPAIDGVYNLSLKVFNSPDWA